MLPSAKSSLIDGGFSPRQASWTLIGCFLGGVLGIQVLSRIMHSFMPSHTVDCEHTHDDEPQKESGHSHEHSHIHEQPQTPRPQTPRSSLPGHMMSPGGGRRRSSRQSSYFGTSDQTIPYAPTPESEFGDSQLQPSVSQPPGMTRRPSLQQRMTNTISQLASKKLTCDSNGPCYGYSDPCGQECFKNINARGGFRAPKRLSSSTQRSAMTRTSSATAGLPTSETTPLLPGIVEEPRPQTNHVPHAPTRYYTVNSDLDREQSSDSSDTVGATGADTNESGNLQKTDTLESDSPNQPEHHHHHVPSNAFLSIGLQTSIAIALHKLPEGFITYATNHANPKLGFSVFLALFIHNITEGFAMALPLYLAINSRVKAMLISFVLGGLSQPVGAAVAAVWFKLAGHGNWAPSEGVYGSMFAVTAGIMASVALQLFSESLDLTHNRNLCMIGAFVGMGILGVSSALTA